MNKIDLPLIVQPKTFADFLQNYSSNENLRIVDLSEESHFRQAHIPGAIFLPYQSLVLGHAPAPGKLPDTKRLQEIFQYLGLTDDTHFVVCDDEGGGWAGRFIWTLDVIGHKNYSYIDGGMLAWKAEGLATTVEIVENPHRLAQLPDIKIQDNTLVDVPMIREKIDAQAVIVWDARSAEEYNGQRGASAKLGHIPGAKNVEWTDLMDVNNHCKIRKDAKQYLDERGINESHAIITHCQTHHRSGFTYLVGKHLGFDIKAYDGSWAEWGSHPDTPVEV